MTTNPNGVLAPAVASYNYEHFGFAQALDALWRGVHFEGPVPGAPAPEFELEDVDGRVWRLADLRGRPVVLFFGSGS